MAIFEQRSRNQTTLSSPIQHDIRFGDEVLLLCKSFDADIEPEKSFVGLFVCDTLGETRQCCVVGTNETGSMIHQGSNHDIHEANFVFEKPLQNTSSYSNLNSSMNQNKSSVIHSIETLHFGQPFLLRHVTSGRYLCGGLGNINKQTINPAPAEIRGDHNNMTLLPPSFVKQGNEGPLDHILSYCIFRFIAISNYGRNEIRSEDSLWLTTETGNLIRGGIGRSHLEKNMNKHNVKNNSNSKENDIMTSALFGNNNSGGYTNTFEDLDPLEPVPFDSYSPILRYEVDICQFGIGFNQKILMNEQGCFVWSLRRRLQVEDSATVYSNSNPTRTDISSSSSSSTTRQDNTNITKFLRFGMSVRLRCLEREALLWAPTASCGFICEEEDDPSEIDNSNVILGLTVNRQLSYPAVYHVLNDCKFKTFGGKQEMDIGDGITASDSDDDDDEVSSSSPSSSSPSAKTTTSGSITLSQMQSFGLLKSEASFKSVFTVDTMEIPGSLHSEFGVLRWGQPFRLRHIVSGCYLAVGKTINSSKKKEKVDNDKNDEYGAFFVSTPNINQSDSNLRKHESENLSELTNIDYFLAATTFTLTPTRPLQVDEDDRIDKTKCVGWLQTFKPPPGCNVCLKMSGTKIVASDGRVELPSILPVRQRETSAPTPSSSSSSTSSSSTTTSRNKSFYHPLLDIEAKANICLRFCQEAKPKDLLQVEMVPCALVGISRMAHSAMIRVRAFENYVRHESLQFRNSQKQQQHHHVSSPTLPIPHGVNLLPDGTLPTSYINNPEDIQSTFRSMTTKPFQSSTDSTKRLQPILEVIERGIQFLDGRFWPDEGRIDVGQSSSNTSSSSSSSSGNGVGLYAPPTRAEIACQYVFDESSDWSTIEPSIGLKRRQGLFRDCRFIDLLMIIMRASRLTGLQISLLFNAPTLLRMVSSLEECLKLASIQNERTQIFIASHEFNGRRQIKKYENGWIGEILASNIEWGMNMFSFSQRSGRANLLINTILLENKLLTSCLLDDEVANFLCKTSLNQGLKNFHAVSLLATTCDSSQPNGQNKVAQERIFNAYKTMPKHINRFDAHVGLFFIRRPNIKSEQNEQMNNIDEQSHVSSSSSPSYLLHSATKAATILGDEDTLSQLHQLQLKEEKEEDEVPWNVSKVDWTLGANSIAVGNEGASFVDTYLRRSLLNSGSDRIFRICLSINPAENLAAKHGNDHWCLSCHLMKTRHHHCPIIGGGNNRSNIGSKQENNYDNKNDDHFKALSPEEERSNLATFMKMGEELKNCEGIEENGKILSDVIQWCHGSSKGIGDETSRWVDMGLVVRLARSSSDHNIVVRYLDAYIHFLTTVVGKRSQLKITQSRFPYEVLLLSMNYFALGFSLRTAFASLLNAAYIDCYPHLPQPLLRTLHLLNPTCTDKETDKISSSILEPNSKKTITDFLQRFQFPGYKHVIHSASKLSLTECELDFSIGAIGDDESPGDAFVHSTCGGKFKLLIESVAESLGDQRLLSLISSSDFDIWTKDYVNGFLFLEKLLGIVKRLNMSCFIHQAKDIQLLVQRLFTILIYMKRDIRSLLLANDNNQTATPLKRVPFSSAQDLAEALEVDHDKNIISSTSSLSKLGARTSSGIHYFKQTSSNLNTVRIRSVSKPSFPISSSSSSPKSEAISQSTSNPMIGDESGTIELTTSSNNVQTEIGTLIKNKNEIKQSIDDDDDEYSCQDEEMLDEAMNIAQRKGLSMKRLCKMFGEANAVALLVHDESRHDRVTDVCIEYEVWTLGQQWHHSQKVTPFVCLTNPDLAIYYTMEAAKRKPPGTHFLSQKDEHEMYGPSSNIDSPEGLPKVAYMSSSPSSLSELSTIDATSTSVVVNELSKNQFSAWNWINSWSLDGKGPLEFRNGDNDDGDGQEWEYGRQLDQSYPWVTHRKFNYNIRRRFWVRRREMKSPLLSIIELIRTQYCSISAAREAIQLTRKHALLTGKKQNYGIGGHSGMNHHQMGRSLDMEYLLLHLKPISDNLVNALKEQENDSQFMLVSHEFLDIEIFSIIFDKQDVEEDVEEDDDDDSNNNENDDNEEEDLGVRKSVDEALNEEEEAKENINLTRDQGIHEGIDIDAILASELDQSKVVSGFEINIDEEDYHVAIKSRSDCFSRSFSILNGFQTMSTDLRISSLIHKLENFQKGIENPTTQECVFHSIGSSSSSSHHLGSFGQRQKLFTLELDPRRAFLINLHWNTKSVSSLSPNSETTTAQVHTEKNNKICDGWLDMRAAVLGLNNRDDASASITSNLMRKLRNDGQTISTLDELSEIRKVIRFIQRLQQAFAYAEIHPLNLFGRFIQDEDQHKNNHTKKHLHKSQQKKGKTVDSKIGRRRGSGDDNIKEETTQKKKTESRVPLSSKSDSDILDMTNDCHCKNQLLDLVALRWLLAGIGFYLKNEDIFILKNVFCYNGNEMLTKTTKNNEINPHRNNSSTNIHYSQEAQQRQQSIQHIHKTRQQSVQFELRKHRSERLVQENIYIVDVKHLLKCLDVIAPHQTPQMSPLGFDLFQSLFNKHVVKSSSSIQKDSLDEVNHCCLDVVSLASESPSNSDGIPPSSSSSSSSQPVQNSRHLHITKNHDCPDQTSALLTILETFIEAQLESNTMVRSSSTFKSTRSDINETTVKSLTLLIRSFRTKAEFVSGLSSTFVTGRPFQNSPDGAYNKKGGDIQRVITALKALSQRLKLFESSSAQGIHVDNIKHELRNGITILNHLSAHILIRKTNSFSGGGCDARNNFQFLLAKSGMIEVAMSFLLIKSVQLIINSDETLSDNECQCSNDESCLRGAASRFILSLMSTGCPQLVIDMVKPYIGDLVKIDSSLQGNIHSKTGCVYIIAALIRNSPELASCIPHDILTQWADKVKHVKFSDSLMRHADSFVYRELFEHLLLSSHIPIPHVQQSIFHLLISSGMFHNNHDHNYNGPISNHPNIIHHQKHVLNSLSMPFAPLLNKVTIDEQNHSLNHAHKLIRTCAPTNSHYFIAAHSQGIRLAAYCCRGSHLGAREMSLKASQMLPLELVIYSLREGLSNALLMKPRKIDERLSLSDFKTSQFYGVNIMSSSPLTSPLSSPSLSSIQMQHHHNQEKNIEFIPIEENQLKECVQGQQFSIHRGYGLSLLPWSYTRGIRAFCSFLDIVYLQKAAPLHSNQFDHPKEWIGMGSLSSSCPDYDQHHHNTWPSEMLTPKQIHELLNFVMDCGKLLKRFILLLQAHLKFISTKNGRIVYCEDKVRCQRRSHSVVAESLEEPSCPTRDTFLLIFSSMIPCLASLHAYTRPDFTTQEEHNGLSGQKYHTSFDRQNSTTSQQSNNLRRNSNNVPTTSNVSKLYGAKMESLMNATHEKAWSSIGSALFELLGTSSLVEHMICVTGAICPEFKDQFNKYMLPHSRNFMERLSKDVLVDFETNSFNSFLHGDTSGGGAQGHSLNSKYRNKSNVEDKVSEEGSSDVDSDVGDRGDSESSEIYESPSIQNINKKEEVVHQDDDDISNNYANYNISYDFIDERGSLPPNDLFEIQSDPHFHANIDATKSGFGSTVSCLHSGGLAINNLPTTLCSVSKLTAIMKRFGKVRSVIIRSQATLNPYSVYTKTTISNSHKTRSDGDKKNSIENEMKDGSASVYFEIPNHKPYFNQPPLELSSMAGFEENESEMIKNITTNIGPIETDEEEEKIFVRLICLPTGCVHENYAISPSDRLMTVLQNISIEITRAVSVLDMRISVNGQEVSRNFKMSTIVQHVMDLAQNGIDNMNAHTNETKLEESISKLEERKRRSVAFGNLSESSSSSSSSSSTSSKLIQVVVDWNSVIAASRSLDAVCPSFLFNSLKPKRDSLRGSKRTTKLFNNVGNFSETSSVTSSIRKSTSTDKFDKNNDKDKDNNDDDLNLRDFKSRSKSSASSSTFSSENTLSQHIDFLDIPKLKMGGVSVLIEDSGIDVFWRKFACAAQSCPKIAKEISNEFDELVDFLLNIHKIANFELCIVIAKLIEFVSEHFKSKHYSRMNDINLDKSKNSTMMNENETHNSINQSSPLSSCWEPSGYLNQSDENGFVSESIRIGENNDDYSQEELCYFILLLLCRIIDKAQINKPYPIGVKWDRFKIPGYFNIKNLDKDDENEDDDVNNMKTNQPNKASFTNQRTVLSETQLHSLSESDIIKKQMQALMVHCRADSAMVLVLSSGNPNSKCFKQALLFSIAILDGGNHQSQVTIRNMMIEQNRSLLIDHLCYVCNSAKQLMDRKAKALQLLGISFSDHTRGKIGKSNHFYYLDSEFIDKLMPVESIVNSTLFCLSRKSSFIIYQFDILRNNKEFLNQYDFPVSEVLTLAQLLCEGHYKGMQDILRTGLSRYTVIDDMDMDAFSSSSSSSSTSTSRSTKRENSLTTPWMKSFTSSNRSTFLSSTISLLNALIGDVYQPRLLFAKAENYITIRQVLRFITEMCQGPNHENQTAAVECCQGALIRAINKLFIFVIGSHQLSPYSPFIRLFGAIIQSSFETLLSITEGRSCTSLQDSTMVMLYNLVNSDALKLRLDISGSLVNYLDKVRRHQKYIFCWPWLSNFVTRHSWNTPSFEPTSITQIPTGPSYFQYISSIYEFLQIQKCPAKDIVEPPWMHHYSLKRHEHVVLYYGSMIYNFVSTMHSMEIKTGGKKFSLQLSSNSNNIHNDQEEEEEESSFISISNSYEDRHIDEDIEEDNDDDDEEDNIDHHPQLKTSLTNEADNDDDDDEDDNNDVNFNLNSTNFQLNLQNETYDDFDDNTTKNKAQTKQQLSSTNHTSRSNVQTEIEEIGKVARTINSKWFTQLSLVRSRRDVFGDRSLSVEVQFAQYGLVRVFFPKPAVCTMLNDTQKARMHEQLDYTLDDAQILREFFRLSNTLLDHLYTKQSLAGRSRIARLRFAYLEEIEAIPWMFSVFINFILLISIRRNKNHIKFEPASFETVVEIFGYLLLVLNISVALVHLTLEAPVLWLSHVRKYELEMKKEEIYGSVRASVLRRFILTAFSIPLFALFIIGIGSYLISLTNIDSNSKALSKILEFFLFILIFPFLKALRIVCSKRPFILRPLPRSYVMIYDLCLLEGLTLKIVAVIVTVVALAGNPLFYSLQLLSILQFSATLRKVVKAVVGPIAQLSMTCFFGLLVIYIFMIVAFWAFPEDLHDNAGYYPNECSSIDDDISSCFDDHVDDDTVLSINVDDDNSTPTMCNSMINCFALFLVNGLLTGGGIGEFISSELGNAPPISSQRTMFRYLFDLAFFAVVTIGLLNLIFGIIIDTFSSIREKAAEETQIRENKCTICGLTRQDFERKEVGGWQRHYKYEHNLWSYYFFLIHLDTKESTEYTGLEDYVDKCRKARSLSWLPRGRALALDETVSADSSSSSTSTKSSEIS